MRKILLTKRAGDSMLGLRVPMGKAANSIIVWDVESMLVEVIREGVKNHRAWPLSEDFMMEFIKCLGAAVQMLDLLSSVSHTSISKELLTA